MKTAGNFLCVAGWSLTNGAPDRGRSRPPDTRFGFFGAYVCCFRLGLVYLCTLLFVLCFLDRFCMCNHVFGDVFCLLCTCIMHKDNVVLYLCHRVENCPKSVPKIR